jgi:S1-C subfamily serine protease
MSSIASAGSNSIKEAQKLINNGNVYEAELYLLKQVQAKDIAAIKIYSYYLIKGKFFQKNIRKGILVLKEGVKLGDTASAYTLGEIYSKGIYLKPNYNKANYFYNLALKNGLKKAQKRIDQISSKIKQEYEITSQKTKVENKKPGNVKTINRDGIFVGISNEVPSWREDIIDWSKMDQGKKGKSGSSFAISNDGKFVTNEHVVNTCTTIFVRYKEKIKRAKLVFKNKLKDIALINIQASTPSFVGFKKSSFKLGEELISGGFPLSNMLDDDIKITTGIVSSAGTNNSDKKRGTFQHSTPIQPGNSGGPLLSRFGQIIGMSSSGYSKSIDGHIPQNINFAVSGETIKNQLQKNKIKYYIDNNKTKYDFELLASILKQSAAQVICY